MSVTASDGTPPVMVLAGAAPGFGAALAGTFAGAGYRVAGLARSTGFGAALEAELASSAGGYRHFQCDVTDPAAVETAMAALRAELGCPKVLIYNPMTLIIGPFQELTPADFEAVWRSTCFGAMITAQAVLPDLLEDGGAILLTGATAAVKGNARFASFASAKFALRGLAQSLAREYGPRGVHVVHTILDGLIWGPQTERRFETTPDRCLDPEAVARTYLQLATQHPSAWTHEIDLRPAHETF